MATGNHSSVPEGFKEIPGYGGRYFINEHGDVWSLPRKRLMRPHVHRKTGYPQVLLQTPGKGARSASLHYLMRLTWMPPAPGPTGTKKKQWCVNHIDGDKTNNHISNLEWLTTTENVKHAWRTGLNRVPVGDGTKNAKFTSDEVRQIRLRLLLGEKVKTLSEEFSVSVVVIKKMQWFISWKHQDHDLVEPMMSICRSKWLRVMMKKLQNRERMEECCNRLSRGRTKWNEDSLAAYLED